MIRHFNKGSVIRNKRSGKPLLVIQSYSLCTLVIDLEAPSPVAITALLIRDYDEWSDEKDMESKNTHNDTIEWEYKPVFL